MKRSWFLLAICLCSATTSILGRFRIQTRQLAAENWCWRKHRWEVRMSGCFPEQDVRTESQRCPINLSNRSVPS